jgi:uncharacterized protein
LSSLADRVRGIVGPPGPRDHVEPIRREGHIAGESPPGLDRPTAAAPEFGTANPDHRDLTALGGDWRDRCFVVERRWEPWALHGRQTIAALGESLERSAGAALLFANAVRAPFVFVDLETTGLSGGAGTYVFLVGCGGFTADGAFATRQFLLTRFEDECRLLRAVSNELEKAGALVSFNGKSFDAPVLETRFLFHRLDWNGARLPHLDVLHPARRFWGPDEGAAAGGDRQGSNCSLLTLERRLLALGRKDDVAGFEIPSRYFRFVRTGDVRPLAAVLEHNRLDLLTLAALMSRLLHLSEAGPEAACTASEALALGRLYVRAGLEARAREAFCRSIDLSRAPAGGFDPIRISALCALAQAFRRVRRYEEAALCWQRLAETRGCPAPVAREAAEALAIHHEHRVRDLEAARTFALRSLETRPAPARVRAVQHRLARLNRKLMRKDLLALMEAGVRPQTIRLSGV